MSRASGRSALFVVVLAGGLIAAGQAGAQVPAEPTLRGRVLLGDTALARGTVVLHRVSESAQGEVDSTRVSADGSFSFRLPAVPDPERSDVYFASVRHAGILYFGKAVTLAVQLDSLYEIQAYDTVSAPPGGAELTVQARNVFLEQSEDGAWWATDLFQVVNAGALTLVAAGEGAVWSHPLAEGARDAEVSRSELAAGGAEVRDGALVVTAPMAPGEHLFVVRYAVPDPFLELPLPAPTTVLEVLVREPAPLLESPSLGPGEPAELEEGVTFRRLTGTQIGGGVVTLVEGRRAARFPVEWTAVLLALLLAGVGIWAAGARSPAGPARAPVRGRRALVLEVARLDEEWASRTSPTAEERGAYEARRRELLRRLDLQG